MGILDNLTRNPGLLGLAALGIGLFIFRDRISGFFSDITGGAAGTAQIAETGGILARNLQSNLTLTPLPEDQIFGEQGIFAGIGKFFSDFKFPELPSFDFIEQQKIDARERTGLPSDFTDVGMAAARGRGPDEGPLKLQSEIGFPRSFSIIRELIGTPFAVANVPETQAQFQERASAFVEALPEVTAFTSLPGSFQGFGRQLSRESEDFESVLAAEARRSETIFAGLFGNVQNPNF